MSNFTLAPDLLRIECDQPLGVYQFASKVAKHYFCQKCGIYPFHQTLRVVDHYRVNLGCIDGLEVEALPVTLFNGRAL